MQRSCLRTFTAFAAFLTVSSAAAAEPKSVIVLDFATSNPDAAEKARATGILVATRLAQRPGVRIAGSDQLPSSVTCGALMQTCPEGPPLLADASDAAVRHVAAILGARWVLRGRLDQFGKRYVLTAVASDAQTAEATGRFRVDTSDDSEIPIAAEHLADTIAQALELPPANGNVELVTRHGMVGDPSAILTLKLGSTLTSLRSFSVETLTLRFDLEGDLVFKPWLLGYLDVGVLFGQATKEGTANKRVFSIVPAGAGLKYVFRSGETLRPFVGLGVGPQFFAVLVDSTKDIAFRVDGIAGVVWTPWERVGVAAELRGEADTERTYGFSANLGVALAF